MATPLKISKDFCCVCASPYKPGRVSYIGSDTGVKKKLSEHLHTYGGVNIVDGIICRTCETVLITIHGKVQNLKEKLQRHLHPKHSTQEQPERHDCTWKKVVSSKLLLPKSELCTMDETDTSRENVVHCMTKVANDFAPPFIKQEPLLDSQLHTIKEDIERINTSSPAEVNRVSSSVVSALGTMEKIDMGCRNVMQCEAELANDLVPFVLPEPTEVHQATDSVSPRADMEHDLETVNEFKNSFTSSELMLECDSDDSNDIERLYSSDVCGKHLSESFTLEHSKTHSSEEKVKFKISTKLFQPRSELKTQQQLHTGEGSIQSDVCGKEFIVSNAMTGEKPYKCDVSEKELTKKKRLADHGRIHTEQKQYKCDVCGKVFISNDRLTFHYGMHTGEKLQTCDVCGKGFSRGYFPEHYRTHTGEKPYKCDVCGKGFIRNDSLILHYRTHTGEYPYTCDICRKGFNNRRFLTEHYRTHTGEKPFKCDICGKGFIRKYGLIGHNRAHTGEKPYECVVCGKGFSLKNLLTEHQKTHREKPYKCDVCGLGFISNKKRTIHYRKHTGEKPYMCDVCGKRYAQNYGLTLHLRIHTGEKPYNCDVCGEAFSRSEYLIKHQRIHTGEKPHM